MFIKKNNVYKYDLQNDEWVGTNLRAWDSMRYFYENSCLLLGSEIIVFGELKYGPTDIFNFKTNTWRKGPYLPTLVYAGQLIKAQPSSQYAAFFIGGHHPYFVSMSSDIYGLTKDLKKFDKLGNLKTPRTGHIALVLPDKAVEKCIP